MPKATVSDKREGVVLDADKSKAQAEGKSSEQMQAEKEALKKVADLIKDTSKFNELSLREKIELIAKRKSSCSKTVLFPGGLQRSNSKAAPSYMWNYFWRVGKEGETQKRREDARVNGDGKVVCSVCFLQGKTFQLLKYKRHNNIGVECIVQ